MVKRWTKQDVECWVDAHMEEAIRDLIRIVNIKSVAELEQPEVKPYGKGCRDVLTEMLSMGREAGFSVRNYDGYVGCISLNDEEKDIGIWAHLDVVEEGDGWQYEPYQPLPLSGGLSCSGQRISCLLRRTGIMEWNDSFHGIAVR